MNADRGVKGGSKPPAQCFQALRCARKGSLIANANKSRIAGIIAVGDRRIDATALLDELPEKRIMSKWIAHPEVMPIQLYRDTLDRIRKLPDTKIATLTFCVSGIMNVAKACMSCI